MLFSLKNKIGLFPIACLIIIVKKIVLYLISKSDYFLLGSLENSQSIAGMGAICGPYLQSKILPIKQDTSSATTSLAQLNIGLPYSIRNSGGNDPSSCSELEPPKNKDKQGLLYEISTKKD
jgi:hypothetical protein